MQCDLAGSLQIRAVQISTGKLDVVRSGDMPEISKECGIVHHTWRLGATFCGCCLSARPHDGVVALSGLPEKCGLKKSEAERCDSATPLRHEVPSDI